jgi:cytochrome c peroxidase
MQRSWKVAATVTVLSAVVAVTGTLGARVQQGPAARASSYQFTVAEPPFSVTRARSIAARPEVNARHTALLNTRYDLGDHPAAGVTMSRGKAIQEGVRVRLPAGTTWDALAAMTPEDIKARGLYPAGFMPLPHPNNPVGGMVFPKFEIDEVKRQEQRDLTRIDVDFDIPDRFLPEFPAPIYLTTRTDLGDVSQGKLVTIMNYYEIFNGILNPKQLEGLRLLLTPFPQQQFNLTQDRLVEQPSLGVACLDCHQNGHTNGATHQVGDIRPQEFRHRIETTPLRGVNVQRLFGSQRALKTVEDFTEFEQRAAYFDGDHVIAAKKGVNTLERGSQVHFMAEFQEILDFPPAPKLDAFARLDPSKATPAEMRGQAVFFGKGQCASCHMPPDYTDNTMHNLKLERFFTPRVINGMMAVGDGPIKTFPLRGIKDSPPYLHDDRLLTLDDTVEFFNLVLGLRLTTQDKSDLVAFMRQL